MSDSRVSRGLARQLARRTELISAGRSHLGWKAGFGAPASLERFDLDGPLIGFMTDASVIADGADVDITGWGRSVAEPEIFVRLDMESSEYTEKTIDLVNEIEQDYIHSLVGYGDQITGIFVRLLLTRAVSYLDLGRNRLAAWDYAAARQLDPEAVDELSERLGGRMDELPALDWKDHCASPGCGMVREIGSEGVIPPRKIHAPLPPFPQLERLLGPQIPMRRSGRSCGRIFLPPRPRMMQWS